MATLQIQDEVKLTPGGKRFSIFKVIGGIDATTYQKFEKKMMAMSSNSVKTNVLDMSECIYINSTGMGLMVRIFDEIKAENGIVYLVSISEEARHTMELLGLMEFFTCFNTLTECLAHVDQPSGSAPAAAPSAGVAKSMYPKKIKCNVCRSILTIKASGKYKCPSCTVYLSAEEDGRVKLVKPMKSDLLSFSIPTAFEWGALLNQSIMTMANKFDISPKSIAAIEPALDEMWSHICKGSKVDNETAEVVFIGSSRGIIMGMIMYGRPIVDKNTLEGSILVKALEKYSDDLQIRSLSENGQVVRLAKFN